ncbi:sigma-54-dependent Fis family transcriptional regulator [bacterium]|nr:sigma-54-dependent Fis family transcriptional regulator [bacterium]
MIRILVVDDEKNLRRTLAIALEGWGHEVVEAASGPEALQKIGEEIYDLMLTDLIMEPMDGLALLEQVRQVSPYTEVLLMSAHGTIDRAVEAIRRGAADFVVKPFAMDYLEQILNRLIAQMDLKRTVRHLRTVLAEHYLYDDMVAASPQMREVMRQVALVADWSIPVLIGGESGVGKELIAIAVHHLSQRKDKPFIPINCGAFADTLLDSELFGHSKGAFTGAVSTKRGLIEEADGGTLFLDEIGESPQALQVRLLRFLDNGKFRRIGEVSERQSDVRIIAASNRDLEQHIKNKEFREDLFYRLSVAVIHIPPLRERKEDIAVLCQRFLELCAKKMDKPPMHLHPQTLALFHQYPWPGNVRELENTIEHSMIVCDGNEIRTEHLGPQFRRIKMTGDIMEMGRDMPLAEIEKQYILSVLKRHQNNKKRAAEILQISRTTLISRLKQYGQDS